MNDTADLIMRMGLTVVGAFMFIGSCRIGLHFYRRCRNPKDNAKETGKITPSKQHDFENPKKKGFKTISADATINEGDITPKDNKISFLCSPKDDDKIFTFRGVKSMEEVLEGVSPKEKKRMEPVGEVSVSGFQGLMNKNGNAEMEDGRKDRGARFGNEGEFNTDRGNLVMKSERGEEVRMNLRGDENETGQFVEDVEEKDGGVVKKKKKKTNGKRNEK